MFIPLSDTLKAVQSRRAPMLRSIDAAETVSVAEAILLVCLPTAIHAAVKPLYVKNRTLTVSCASAAAAAEVRMVQQSIIDQLNEKLGKKEVDRLRYLV